ncbi:signal recognition particle-docking protein FtsY [Thiomicrorhabdus sediminis]|uniref:Signal recognition particle receptor FtsY n=1 Tax=Thiomicrorhabdus sediminis TaxID=2580412 RepID=A0A4P9K9B3_9GAMM|nr:signal recognition particle-docking protein FtsY [Thiomicrorhabdus sediminis]QCU90917.1 signal recognition particle-docking protein FtsY [Thiomicrorhabdus sediminis]
MFSFFSRKKQQENQDTTTEENLTSEESEKSSTVDSQDTTEQTTANSEAEDNQLQALKSSEAKTDQPPIEPAVAEESSQDNSEKSETEVTVATEPQESPAAEKKAGFFTRLKQGLSKTRQNFTDSLANLVLGRKEIDDDLLDDLEMILLTADVGVEATDRIIQNLTDQVSRKELKDPQALMDSLKQQLESIIEPMSVALDVDAHLAKKPGPFVILMVGINGVGKTTTIGKLAKKFQLEGKSVMLAAGDTFRAAAVEQLQTWGERNQVPVIAQKTGADSAAVIFDAIQSAKAKGIDVLIADTAGRLHTQSNLMEELKKVKRVMSKVDETAPHEVMLVIDAGTGQNALNQAKQFGEAVDISGITLTKLDGTAKGGIVYALAEQQQIPIRYIGVGESIDDLREFDAKSFTQALFSQSE